MSGSVQVLERPVRNCPLGVRFQDTVSGAVADDGLVVVAYPRRQPHRRVQAEINRSGVYVFTNLPGLRAYEFGLEEPAAPTSPPSLSSFVLEVADAGGRYLPFVIGVEPPLDGLLRWEEAPVISPPGSPRVERERVPLYPAPARPAPAGMAVVRAELHDRAGHAAAWAVLEVLDGGRLLGRSYADERGRVAVMFAYPEPLNRVPGSPGGGAMLPLAQHQWPVQIGCRYGRVPPVPALPDSRDPRLPQYPDLRAVFTQGQTIVELDVSPVQPLPDPTLKYGRELVLRSRDAAPAISHVVIAPAASPPTP